MTDRVTHKHVTDACQRYNAARRLSYGDAGYLQWADIRGDGTSRRSLYVGARGGGVASSYWRGATMRETVANINLALMMWNADAFVPIINAIHERGKRQVIALDILSARGLWLSDEQKKQAGIA